MSEKEMIDCLLNLRFRVQSNQESFNFTCDAFVKEIDRIIQHINAQVELRLSQTFTEERLHD